jgi:ATP-dependent RNA helicase DHX8/PRP22
MNKNLICSICCIADEDMEVEIVEEEPPFLSGHGRHWVDLSPVKIVKVSDDQ